MSSFGEELGRLMKEKGFVQKTLADAVGIDQTFISKLIRGEKKRLGADVLFKLAKALDVECTHFAGYFTDDATAEPAPASTAKKPKGKGKS